MIDSKRSINYAPNDFLKKENEKLTDKLTEAEMWIKRYEYQLAKLNELREGCYSDTIR